MSYLVACVLLTLAPREGVQVEGAHPFTLARAFSLGSKPVWSEVVRLMDELGLKTERLDAENQIAFTRKLEYGDKRFEKLLTPERRKTPGTVQLQIFVSPFVEPARVYMGSISDDGRRVIYNAAFLEHAFLTRLGDRLGEAGVAVPDPGGLLPRHSKSQSLKAIEPPKKIFDAHPLYPGPALAAKKGATVIVESIVTEDGVTTRLKPIDVLWGNAPNPWNPTPVKGTPMTHAKDEQLRRELFAAAMGAVSLWRYRPLFDGERPIPVVMTVTVHFSAR